MRTVLVRAVALVAAVALAAACGDDADSGGTDGRPRVVVTTSILGDIVSVLVGDDADVEVIIPLGADPHDLAPSPRQVEAILDADAVVVNGQGLEHGLVDPIELADDAGVPLVVAAAEDVDPHFFTDPLLMRDAVLRIERALTEDLDLGLDVDAVHQRAVGLSAGLDEVHVEIAGILAPVPAERRLLVTNHETLGSFAARYGFEVLGSIHPGGSTLGEPSAAEVAAMADEIRARGVPAIFADASSSAEVAEALADEGLDLEVVELHTESLGPAGSGAETYLDLVRSNATAIVEALS